MWKKITHQCVIAAALLATLSVSALAGELVLYEYQGFVGRSLTLRGAAPNFNEVGFNDRAESVVVVSGSWQVCTDAQFGGLCATITPGEYRQLDARFSGRLSSAREVGVAAQPVGVPSGYGAPSGMIEFFEGQNFTGASVRLERDAANFGGTGFNDRASSAVVHGGTWDICNDADYRGTCRSLVPGRYADLGYGMARNVSSARMTSAAVSTGTPVPSPYVIGGYDGGAASGPALTGRLVLYDADGFVGRNIAFTQNTVDLQPTGFNDQALSAVVESGHWEVCADSHFRGQCQVLRPGLHSRLDPVVVRNVSSARLVAGSGRRGREGAGVGGAGQSQAAPSPMLELFENDGYGGRRVAINADSIDLNQQGFNDIASSLVIYTGQWQLCTDARYGGRCAVFGPGQYASLGGLNDQLSSLRRVDR